MAESLAAMLVEMMVETMGKVTAGLRVVRKAARTVVMTAAGLVVSLVAA